MVANNLVPSQPEGQLLIYQDGKLKVQVRIDGQTVWLNQRLIAELYQVSVKTINEHLINIYAEGELDPSATIRKFRIVQTEETRRVSRMIDYYNLDVIPFRCRDDMSTTSTRERNVSPYLVFIDTLCKRVHARGMNVPKEMPTTVGQTIWANVKGLGHGG